MANRKPIPKAVRFEVFKRDKFTCQYCGRMSPDVILEIDHIKPVAEGGTNDLINLITSCRDCNRGKGKRRLDDNTELQKQKEQLKDLAVKREQLEMMVMWREELLQIAEMQTDSIDSYIKSITPWEMSDIGRADIKRLLKRFGYNEVYEATEIAFRQYYKGTDSTWGKAFSKIGGICYNRKMQREATNT